MNSIFEIVSQQSFQKLKTFVLLEEDSNCRYMGQLLSQYATKPKDVGSTSKMISFRVALAFALLYYLLPEIRSAQNLPGNRMNFQILIRCLLAM